MTKIVAQPQSPHPCCIPVGASCIEAYSYGGFVKLDENAVDGEDRYHVLPAWTGLCRRVPMGSELRIFPWLHAVFSQDRGTPI